MGPNHRDKTNRSRIRIGSTKEERYAVPRGDKRAGEEINARKKKPA